jgi:ribosomal protein S18 acetylase RimI-like enzyme
MAMSEPALRRATAADAERLSALARAAYARHVAAIGREPMPMTADWARLLSEQEIWILDGPAGEAVASLALEVQADHVTIWSVAVAPAHQRHGLGRRLMALAEARARALGRPELRLFTNARMAGNVALYRRLGYAETQREELPDRVLVHMSKAVRAEG